MLVLGRDSITHYPFKGYKEKETKTPINRRKSVVDQKLSNLRMRINLISGRVWTRFPTAIEYPLRNMMQTKAEPRKRLGPTEYPTGGATISPSYVRKAAAIVAHHINNIAQIIAYCSIMPDAERRKCLGECVQRLQWVSHILIPELLQGRLKRSQYSPAAYKAGA